MSLLSIVKVFTYRPNCYTNFTLKFTEQFIVDVYFYITQIYPVTYRAI